MKRSDLLESSYNTIMGISDVEHLKSRLYVKFEGESGLDYGGLARYYSITIVSSIFYYFLTTLESGSICSLMRCLILTTACLNILQGNSVHC